MAGDGGGVRPRPDRRRRHGFADRRRAARPRACSAPGSTCCSTTSAARGCQTELVASTTRWVAVDGRLVGFLSVRHELNDYLLELGGHIGYAIRPLERGQGYATAATALALEECRRLGIDRVLITCDDTNVASATVIERNGGVLEDLRGGKRRYWVDLP